MVDARIDAVLLAISDIVRARDADGTAKRLRSDGAVICTWEEVGREAGVNEREVMVEVLRHLHDLQCVHVQWASDRLALRPRGREIAATLAVLHSPGM